MGLPLIALLGGVGAGLAGGVGYGFGLRYGFERLFPAFQKGGIQQAVDLTFSDIQRFMFQDSNVQPLDNIQYSYEGNQQINQIVDDPQLRDQTKFRPPGQKITELTGNPDPQQRQHYKITLKEDFPVDANQGSLGNVSGKPPLPAKEAAVLRALVYRNRQQYNKFVALRGPKTKNGNWSYPRGMANAVKAQNYWQTLQKQLNATIQNYSNQYDLTGVPLS